MILLKFSSHRAAQVVPRFAQVTDPACAESSSSVPGLLCPTSGFAPAVEPRSQRCVEHPGPAHSLVAAALFVENSRTSGAGVASLLCRSLRAGGLAAGELRSGPLSAQGHFRSHCPPRAQPSKEDNPGFWIHGGRSSPLLKRLFHGTCHD